VEIRGSLPFALSIFRLPHAVEIRRKIHEETCRDNRFGYRKPMGITSHYERNL